MNATPWISEFIVQRLREFLSRHGYVTKKYHAEIHHQTERNVRRKFPWHVDSDGAIPGQVVTFLYYHHQTGAASGGRLLIRERKERRKWWALFDRYTEKAVDVWSSGHRERFVFMRENVYHKAEDIASASFERKLMAIFFQV